MDAEGGVIIVRDGKLCLSETENCALYCSGACVNIIIDRREAWVMP